MCGIVGSLYRSPANSQIFVDRKKILLRMVNSLLHRGPDAQDFHGDPYCFLGFTRLALVGGKISMQPLANEDKTVFLICNGEIYNHQELRKLLEKRSHRFSTFSDCEVILHLYEDLGEKFVDKLRGQFAFVIWDSRNQKLLAARDRFGICPFFYTHKADGFIFASEIKAILEDPRLTPKLDVQGIAETAFFYSPTPPLTCFEDIFRLPPASILLIDLNSWKVKIESYWDLPLLTEKMVTAKSRKKQVNSETLQRQLRQLIKSTVEVYARHGDEPVAVSISGGIDSSIIATFAAQAGVDTSFGITFLNKKYDESYFQRKLARRLGFKHHEFFCKDDTILKLLPHVVWHAECPLFRTAPIPLYGLASLIHEAGVKAILSGEGADELFCGYPVFYEGEIRSILSQFKTDGKLAKKWIEKFLNREIDNDEFNDLATKFSFNHSTMHEFPSHSSRWKETRRLLSLFANGLLPADTSETALERLSNFMRNGRKNLTSLAWAQQAEIVTKQEGYILAAQGDRVSMAHAVEKRLPYLDRTVADFALQIGESLRQHGENDKYILREMMRNILPDEIVNRPKQGYLAPGDTPFAHRQTKNSYVEELLSDSEIKRTGYFNLNRVKEIKNRIELVPETDRKFTESAYIFILTTQVLHRLFLEKDTSILLS